jgi:hypothetical protein
MLLLAAAVFLPAGTLMTELVRIDGWNTAWTGTIEWVAMLVLFALVARTLPSGPGRSRPAPAPGAPFVGLRAVAGITIAAAVTAGPGTAADVYQNGFTSLIVLPCVYLSFMWMLALPVIVIEGAGPIAALRRSWRLIHGHGLRLLSTLLSLFIVWLAVMVVAVFIGVFPGMPDLLRSAVPQVLIGVFYGPFAAAALTLAYYRLAAAGELAAAVSASAAPEG